MAFKPHCGKPSTHSQYYYGLARNPHLPNSDWTSKLTKHRVALKTKRNGKKKERRKNLKVHSAPKIPIWLHSAHKCPISPSSSLIPLRPESQLRSLLTCTDNRVYASMHSRTQMQGCPNLLITNQPRQNANEKLLPAKEHERCGPHNPANSPLQHAHQRGDRGAPLDG